MNDMFCSELKVIFGIETYQSFRLMMIINHKAIAEWKKYTQIIVVIEWTGRHQLIIL